MLRLLLRLLLLLIACGCGATFETSGAFETTWCHNEGGQCRYKEVNLTSLKNGRKAVYCMHNQPFMNAQLLTGGVLRLFDVQTVTVRGSSDVIIKITSDDTWLTDATQPDTAEERAVAALNAEESLFDVIPTFTFSRSTKEITKKLSPFHASCVALKASRDLQQGEALKLEWRRDSPVGRDAEPWLWVGPLLVFAGVALYSYADTLAKSVVFHYASSISVFMVLSMLLLGYIVWSRTGRGGKVTGAFAFTGVFGAALAAWIREQIKAELHSYWPYFLAYFGAFGVLGYAYQFMRLKGGRPPVHECALVARFLQLLALVLLGVGSYSVRAKLTLLGSAVLLPGISHLLAPPGRLLGGLLQRFRARGAQKAPSWYRAPTASGQYLSAEQYEEQGRIATDAGMQSLFKSPEYQAWLLANHHRLQLSGDQMRQPTFDEGEVDEMLGLCDADR